MPVEENKAFVRQFLQRLWQGNTAVADAAIPSPILREAVKHAVNLFRTIFPDLRFTIEELVAEEDKVVARCIMRGTYTFRLLGTALVNRPTEVSYIAIYRIDDNQVKAFTFLRDELNLLRQLGPVAIVLLMAQYGRRLARQ